MEEREQEEGSSSQNVKRTVTSVRERGAFLEIILSDSSSFFIFPEDYAGLRPGIEDAVSEGQLEQLIHRDRICRAYGRALNILSFAPATAFMLRQKLVSKGFDSRSAAAAVQLLKEKKILDDRKYAENWVSSRIARNPESPFALKAALMRKGIERYVADEVLAGMTPDSEAYIEAFERAFRKQTGKPGKTHDKIRSFLARKGYPLSLINKYLDSLN